MTAANSEGKSGLFFRQSSPHLRIFSPANDRFSSQTTKARFTSPQPAVYWLSVYPSPRCLAIFNLTGQVVHATRIYHKSMEVLIPAIMAAIQMPISPTVAASTPVRMFTTPTEMIPTAI